MPVANSARNYRSAKPLRSVSGAIAHEQVSGSRRAGFADFVVAAVMITGALLFYVYLHVSTLAIGYDLSRIRNDQLNLLREQRALKTEVGSLAAPGRIRKIANEQLGMQPARKIERVEVSP